VSLAGDLLKKFEPEIASLTLVPSDGGRFEVSVNDRLIYSKLKAGGMPNPARCLDYWKILSTSEAEWQRKAVFFRAPVPPDANTWGTTWGQSRIMSLYRKSMKASTVLWMCTR